MLRTGTPLLDTMEMFCAHFHRFYLNKRIWASALTLLLDKVARIQTTRTQSSSR